MSSRQRGGSTLSVRFLLYYAITYLILIGSLAWFIDRQVRQTLVDNLVTSLETSAEVARVSMPNDVDQLGAWASSVFAAGEFRVTVIDTGGVVVADSHSDPTVMENHADRPEVATALAGEIGRDSRTSVSTGFAQHYLALPVANGLVLRASISERSVVERLTPIRTQILVGSALVGLIGVAAVGFLARRLARPIQRLTQITLAIAGGERDRRPPRSPVSEVDQLGLAISQLANDLGSRITQTESVSATLEIVLGALPQGTILVGADDEILYANPTAYQLLGAVPDSLVGLDPHRFQIAVREARETRQPVDVLVDHGSPVRRIRGVATPFTDDPRILLIILDATDRERAASVRRDFVANASHELKTPVSSIISSSEALRTALDRDPQSARPFAAHIEKAARQLDRLVSDLLDLSRLEREMPGNDPVRVDLVVSEEVRQVSGAAQRAGVSVTADVEPVTVAGNRRDLSIVCRNLLENAVRYSADGGEVAVVVRSDQGVCVIEVADNGLGIPSRDLDRVFERFYRVDSARSRETGGTGLGLSIVRHAVESHGGTVEARSELGRGSTFTVRLPLMSNGDSGEMPLA